MKMPAMDVATYSVAKRMEAAGRLRPGAALMLAATLPSAQVGPLYDKAVFPPQKRGKTGTTKGKRK